MKDIWRNGDRRAEVYRSTCWTGINCPRKACYNVRGVRLGVTEFVTRQSAHARLIKLGFSRVKEKA